MQKLTVVLSILALTSANVYADTNREIVVLISKSKTALVPEVVTRAQLKLLL
jgi:hypothetical protein